MSSEAATRATDPPDPMIGKVLDERYRIEEPLGQGGIGRVYKARHLILGRHVALKVLLAQYESIPVLQERFRREAEALAALSHPNIVTVTDFGVFEAMPYLAMELLEGEDLARLIDREVLEPKRAFGIVRQVLRALAYAHSRELVHRDLKPHNIWVRALGDGTDHVEVLDFGLARFLGESANRGPKLTKAGALIGTPAYMAPEQASGEAVDARADVYAMGIVIFEALTGRKPFESRDPGEILRSHLLVSPPRLAQVDPGLRVGDALEALVARSLAKSPSERFQTITDMLAALDALPPDVCVRVGPRPPRDQPLRRVDATQGGVDATRAATPGAVRATNDAAYAQRAPETSIHLPKSRLPVLAGIGCAAGVLVGGAVLAAILIGGVGEDDPPPPSHPAPPASTTTPVPAPPPQGGGSPGISAGGSREHAWRDPFAEPLPPELVDIAARVANVSGRRPLSSGDERALRAWDAAHPTDVRARMLLARAEANRRYQLTYERALEHYEQAYERDPTVRGDPEMRADVLEMARSDGGVLRRNTRAFAARAYGHELLDDVDRAIAEVGGDRDALQRLEELRGAILATPDP